MSSTVPAMSVSGEGAAPLPAKFAKWFVSRGWAPRAHQLALARAGLEGRSALLIAPTGGGKTLAGFLPSLIEIAAQGTRKPGQTRRLHTLYLSPLKALAVDVARNLEAPITEMGLDVRVETRTGDTPQNRRQRQRRDPPDILMTTPEQLALLLSYTDSDRFFGGLKVVVLDELHALAPSKRGDLLALGLSQLRRLSPAVRMTGLSATVENPERLRRYLVPQDGTDDALADLVVGEGGATPNVSILASKERIPWSGHSSRHAMREVYDVICDNKLVLVFVNTRSQAEFVFQALWHLNEQSLPIALHHGSLAPEKRRKVEAAMAKGTLRAVVCTSTLDLGIDWGDVDLVINIGAPKGASRLLQRIGRANHRLDEPSKALLVPSNRFEVLECEAAREAAQTATQDGDVDRAGALDVLAQHILCIACAAPFDADILYKDVISASPYRDLPRATFDQAVSFVATGGYALKSYDRFARLRQNPDGLWRLAHPSIAQRYRMNVGTIVEAPMMRVRLVRRGNRTSRGGPVLGEVEEYFIEQLAPGDTFLFAGQVLRFEGIQEQHALASRTRDDTPAIPSYYGGKFPLSTYLADRVRQMMSDPAYWKGLPDQVSDWLKIQQYRSVLPKYGELLVEIFPRADKFYMVMYPFDGRLAHQTLGMLLTRRLERYGARPMGFVASEYALAIWCLRDPGMMAEQGAFMFGDLFDEDMLGDDLEAWLAESYLLKRTFRNCAVIAGLIERRFPGHEKSGRQVTFSSDLIYDVLREHEPDHILMQATWADASSGLLDLGRLAALLARIKNRIVVKRLERVSPLAVPVMLEIGKEQVAGAANESLLAEASDQLIEDAMRLI
ncbi:ligase-associated DNA damage response DEXH box helicase [Pyruvatibacter sp.]|uniref:ligase-associated DNA damage response DEXH box helicase n=1 Tax=Pyruvatibacter sp. TaxID=1981328 RepID=UPI0032EB0050